MTRFLLVGLLALASIIASPVWAQSPIQAQIEAGYYARNFDCVDIYTTCQQTFTTPASSSRSTIWHWEMEAGGGGGCPYQGVGGNGGRLKLDLTNLPPGTVITVQRGGAGVGCGSSMSGATQGGHVWIKYNDPNMAGNPLWTYSANGGRPDNAGGGGRGGQGCDDESGGCTGNPDDPNLILASFNPEGGGDGSPANLFPAGASGPIGAGNAGGSGGQNTPLGAGRWGTGGGGIGPGGINCTLPCNRGGQLQMMGYDGYPAKVSVERRGP